MPRWAWGLVVLVVLALATTVLWLDRRQVQRGAVSLLGVPWARPAARPRAPVPPRPARVDGGGPRVAVVVDQLGARPDVAELVLGLGGPLTLAVLPELPLSRRIVREAHRAGLEVLLQLPLEPYDYPEQDPGPGVLLSAMAPAEVGRRTRQHLGSLPGIAGVATHMGSRFTEDEARMRAVLEAVREAGLFFVDGRSSQRSVGYDLARTLRLPAARRQVALDPEEREATVRAGLLEAERWATRRGSVVVIGHGRLLTVRLLGETLPRWGALGFRLVPVSALVDWPGSSEGG